MMNMESLHRDLDQIRNSIVNINKAKEEKEARHQAAIQRENVQRKKQQESLEKYEHENHAWLELLQKCEDEANRYCSSVNVVPVEAVVTREMIDKAVNEIHRSPSGADLRNRSLYLLSLCKKARMDYEARRPIKRKAKGTIRIIMPGDGSKEDDAYTLVISSKTAKNLFDQCKFAITSQPSNIWGFKAETFPLPVDYYNENLRNRYASIFRIIEENLYIMMPCTHPANGFFVCKTTNSAQYVYNTILNDICLRVSNESSFETHWRSVIVDAVTLNDISISSLIHISGDESSAYCNTPCHNSMEANDILSRLWRVANKEDVKERDLLIRGYPEYIDKTIVERLVKNASRLKLRVFIISENTNLDPSFASHVGIEMYTEIKEYSFLVNGKLFELRKKPMLPCDISADKVNMIKEALRTKQNAIEYVYPLPSMISFKKTIYRDGFRLLFGISDTGKHGYYDTKDNVDEKGMVAGFVVGTPGSGKSTWLHTLISDIIFSYHPDEVELWLADFKMKEFSEYIRYCPPHVRYILLDESPDMVRSFIDKMTEERIRRQRLISSTPRAKWYQDVKGLPLIFVVIDEFSIMSQAIQGDENYKRDLQNMITQGRDQGFRFLFSCQFYDTGIGGLSTDAKDAIGLRYAMYCENKQEMRDTLNMPQRLTDEQSDQIRLLPKHDILVREGTNLEQFHVYYFNKTAEVKRWRLIKQIIANCFAYSSEREKEKLLEQGIPERMLYKKKDRLFIDNHPETLDTFDDKVILFREELAKKQPYTTLLWLGRPRSLERSSAISLKRIENENILICSNYRSNETQRYGLQSILKSMAKSMALQDGEMILFLPTSDLSFTESWLDLPSNALITDITQATHVTSEIENQVVTGVNTTKRAKLLVYVNPEEMIGTQHRQSLLDKYSPSNSSRVVTQSSQEVFDSLLGIPGTESVESNKNSRRSLKEMIPYLLLAGSTQGVHVVIVTTQFATLFRGVLVPGEQRRDRIDCFRHRVAFRLSENDSQDDYELWLQSRRELKESLISCFMYQDGNRIVMREPYRIAETSARFPGEGSIDHRPEQRSIIRIGTREDKRQLSVSHGIKIISIDNEKEN